MKIIAVLTSFNRRDQTLACLAALEVAARTAAVDASVVLVDDASTDGTADAVGAAYPDAIVIRGKGDMFWNRGMHRGMEEALSRAADYILWLNDDTLLRPDALIRILADAKLIEATHGYAAIIVGSTAGADGRVSYGGSVAAGGFRPITYTRVWSAHAPVPCDVMNGNCVLFPHGLAQAVGNLDPLYEHAMGDTDYALRARKAGFHIYVASGIVGMCLTNPIAHTASDLSLPLVVRWRKMLHRKGLPWRSWLHFTRRHTGVLWPIYFVWPYLRLLLSAARRGV